MAEWHQQEWADLNPGSTLQDRVDKMADYLNDAFISTTCIATNNNYWSKKLESLPYIKPLIMVISGKGYYLYIKGACR